MRRSGPRTQRGRYQSPATLPGLWVEVMVPPSLNGPCEGSGADKNLRRESATVHYRLNSSRRRFVCARLTGISVCFLSFMRSW